MDYFSGVWKFFPEENYYEFLLKDRSKLNVFVPQSVLKYSSADGKYSEAVVYNAIDGIIVKIEGSRQTVPFLLINNKEIFLNAQGLRQQGRSLVELVFKNLGKSIL